MLGNIVTSAGQLLAGQLGTGPEQVTGALLMLVFCGGIWFVGWNRRQRAANKPGMNSLPIIIACFAIALIAVGAGAYGIGLRSAPTPTSLADPKIAELTNERDSAIRDRDNARQQLASRPAPQSESFQPVAPKRIYDPEEKARLKRAMLSISDILNTDGMEIVRKSQRYTNPMEDQLGAKANFDLVKELQDKTQSLYERIFRKIIPENKFFERDLAPIVGADDTKNVPYLLIQQLGTFFGQLNMVLVLIPKMKEDPTGTTERQLLGMATGNHKELSDAALEFRKWVTQCNERIDEKTRDLQ
jgi:hypothetical protein